MKTTSHLWSVLVLFLTALPLCAQTNDLTALLQQGLLEEQANRNPQAAIADYQALAQQFDKNRQIAATAIFRLGECYRMLGRTNEAAAQYQRILKEFSDQSPLVTLSREDLVGMGVAATVPAAPIGASGPTPVGGEVSTSDSEAQEIQRIQIMIQNSPDMVNAPDGHGHTPLENAAINGWLKVAAFLLDHGADVTNSSAINFAAKAGNRAMTEYLLSRGADVNTKDSDGNTALAITADHGFPAVMEVLLSHKADVNSRNNFGRTPLMWATWQNRSGNEKILQMLLGDMPDVNVQDQSGATALMNACDAGTAAAVKLLVDAGANPNLIDQKGRTALSYAAEHKSQEKVKLLLDAKADPNMGAFDASLLEAIYMDDTNCVELLLQAGANPNAKGIGDWKVQIGNVVYERGNAHITPLWMAISEKQSTLVRLLLKYKADPNDSQTENRSVLFNALSDTNILEALLDAGADLNAQDKDFRVNGYLTNWTPLAAAVWGQEVETVEILLRHGADSNVKDSTGNTPLLDAVSFLWVKLSDQQRKIIELLLNDGANPNVPDSDGHTPLDLVKGRLKDSNRQVVARQIADLLRQHGALDRLPDWNHITVIRPSGDLSQTVFDKDTNNWNHFTLLQTLAQIFPVSPSTQHPFILSPKFLFPDLFRLTILRPEHGSTNQTVIKVNLLDSSNNFDCSKDIPLEFGDVVEIPEYDHLLNAPLVGLTQTQFDTIQKFLAGKVQLVTPSQKVELSYRFLGGDARINDILRQSDAQNVLQSSSDLSRVKVTRRDPQTGQTHSWTLDCHTNPYFFVKDGDVIEVPDRTN